MSDALDIPEEMAIRTLLVPLDGSRLAEAAVAPSIAVATGVGAAVTLLHVLEHDAPTSVHGEPHLATAAAATAYLERVAGRYAAAGVAVSTHVHANPERDVTGAIAAHAEELDADLVMLASHGSGGLRGFLFGRVAQQVVRRGTRPVLIVQVRGDDEARRPFVCKTIALLLSGTDEAEAAVPVAVTLAKALGARLHLISAVPTVGTLGADRAASATLMPGAARAVLSIEEDTAQTYLRGVAAELGSRGLGVTTAVVRGDPADATVDEANRVGADMLALATHGRQGLGGIWAGSVGAKVLSRFDRALLLARAPG
ncbi:MAG TPA: universal stress protein [Thermomicrobiales bacterium]|jgi:nucleotide-binding universal stress UspA family protein